MIKNTVIFKHGDILKLKMSEENSITLNKAFVDQGVNPGPAVINVEAQTLSENSFFWSDKKLVHILIANVACIIEG